MTGSGSGRRLGRPTIDEAAELREAFLNRAYHMLCDRGVHGFSVEALAKASGVTKRTIYRQFDSKAALVEAVVEREMLRLVDGRELALEGASSPIARLQDWGWQVFQFLGREDTQRLSFLLRFASLSEPWAADMLTRWTDKLLGAARELVIVAQESGDLRVGDPDILVALLLDLIDGIYNRLSYSQSSWSIRNKYDIDYTFKSRWAAFVQLASPDWYAQP